MHNIKSISVHPDHPHIDTDSSEYRLMLQWIKSVRDRYSERRANTPIFGFSPLLNVKNHSI